MKIVVLVKQVPDTWGERRLGSDGRLDRDGEVVVDEVDERAVEVALTAKDRDRHTEVVVMTMGPARAGDALRQLLALGADRALHVVDDELAGADAMATAQVLAAAVRREGFDLVLAGGESTDGRGGVVPAMLAELLGVPLLSGLSRIELSEATVTGTRVTEGGIAQVRAPLPAVASVTEALPEARFGGLRGVLAAKRKPITRVSRAELGLAPVTARTRVQTAQSRPGRGRGVTVPDDGTAVDRLVELLVDRHVI